MLWLSHAWLVGTNNLQLSSPCVTCGKYCNFKSNDVLHVAILSHDEMMLTFMLGKMKVHIILSCCILAFVLVYWVC